MGKTFQKVKEAKLASYQSVIILIKYKIRVCEIVMCGQSVCEIGFWDCSSNYKYYKLLFINFKSLFSWKS